MTASKTAAPPVVQASPVESAREARLRYVSDADLGISREHTASGFRYVDADARPIRDSQTLQRIRKLAIPPAWKEVWICPIANGHLQATGRDARGRKQYRYHQRWREVRDSTKYDRMIAFAEALPAIRARVAQDLSLPGLPRNKVLAAVVRLMETTHIRVGNDEYARTNKSFGITTLRNRHVSVDGRTIHLEFRGKSGVRHAMDVTDRRLANIVRKCRELPGQELFEYFDEAGEPHDVTSDDVNTYLREASGQDFSAKDFRTWAGTVLAAAALRQCGACESEAQAKQNVAEAIRTVAAQLGNTPAVCRKCYVHPAVLDRYAASVTEARRSRRKVAVQSQTEHGLRPEEEDVLQLLREGAKARQPS